jgi:hypothetical protein
MRVRRLLDGLPDDALGDDPRQALVAARRLQDELLPWVEARAVLVARRNDWNWARIGRLLGKTRQAIRQRYATRLPQRVTDGTMSPFDREYFKMLDDLRRRREFDGDDVIAW